MADLFDLVAKLTLDSSQYEQGLNSALGKITSIGGTIAKVGTAAVTAMASAAAGATVALTKSVSEVAQYGDNIDKMSQKMGLSAQAYQEWDAIMQHSGTSIDSLQAGMKTLANAVENNNDAFGRLGITQEQIASMNQEELFSATISALQNVEDETERTYLAGQLLGRGATELGALLNTSAEDTEKMRQRVHELGGVMSDDAVKAAAAFQDNLQDLKTAVNGVKRSFTQALLPGFNDVLAGFTSLIAGEEGAEEQLTNGISNIVETFSGMAPRITDVLTGIGGAVISALPQIASGAMSIVETLGSTILSSAPNLIDSALSIIGVLADGLIQAAPQLIDSALAIVTELVNGVAEMAPAILPAAASLITELAMALTNPETLTGILQGALAIITGLGDGLIQAVGILAQAAPEIINNLVTFIVANLPMIIQTGLALIQALVDGIIQNLEPLLTGAVQIVTAINTGILQMMPELIPLGLEITTTIFTALIENLPLLLDAGIQIIMAIVEGILNNIDALLQTGIELIQRLFDAIVNAASQLIDAGKEMVQKVKDGFMEKVNEAKQWGKDLINNFIGGLREKWENLKSTVSNIAATVKSFLGFSEPEEGPLSDFHTYAPDMMDLFMKGIRDNENALRAQVAHTFDFSDSIVQPKTVTYTAPVTTKENKNDAVVIAINDLKNVLLNQKWELDGEVVAANMEKRIGDIVGLKARV